MRTVLWVLGWIGVAVWTLVALAGWGFLGLFGEVARSASGHVPGFPVETFSAAWLADAAHRLGSMALVVVWAFGTLMILAVPAVASLFFKRRDRAPRVPEPRDLPWQAAGRSIGPLGADFARRLWRVGPRRRD